MTFLYYSYSFDDSETIGLIKYGNKDVETITHKTVHARTKILGGNDNDRTKHHIISTLFLNPMTRNPEDEPKFETIGGGEKRFLFECAISGFYRWR